MTGARGALLSVAAAALLWWRMRPGSEDPEEPEWEPHAMARLAAWQPARPRTTAGQAACALWASPLTLAGLLVAVASRARVRLDPDGFLVVSERGPLSAQLQRRGFSAATMGHVVIAVREPSAGLLRHERMHTRQAERLGVLFGPVYLLLLALYGYRKHPLERAARRAARSSAGA